MPRRGKKKDPVAVLYLPKTKGFPPTSKPTSEKESEPPTSLFEVFTVIYLGSDDVRPENQLGTIQLHSPSGVQYVYKLETVDKTKETIKYGDEIALAIEGPTPCFMECVEMHCNLFCGAYQGVEREAFDWTPGYEDEAFVKHIRFGSIDGTGEIVVLMGFYAQAMVAEVEVKLLGNSAASNVSGVVAASNSKLDSDICTSILFLKNAPNGTTVGPDGVIPLSKTHVAVPFNSHLNLDISLNVNGEEFTTSLVFRDCEEQSLFCGDRDQKIQVKVTWSSMSFGHDEL